MISYTTTMFRLVSKDNHVEKCKSIAEKQIHLIAKQTSVKVIRIKSKT